MASPQKENGYTPIAHEILEAVARYPLNGTQIKILLVIWRYTFGFNRKEHQLSESFIAKATGTSKRYISSELNRLIDLKIIRLIFPATYTKPKTIAFNKNYEQWAHSGTIVQQVKNTSTVEQNFNTPVEELFHSTVEELFHQERNNIKKKEINEHFEKLWLLYPKKKGKGSISDSKKKELYEVGYEQLKRAISRYIDEIRKNNTEDKYVKYGSTFFNSGYQDYLDANYIEASNVVSIPSEPTNPEYLKLKQQLG